ncbi:MAG: hypothetical protein P8102_10395 [Gammaproteobacteria bacterium]
MPSDKLDRRLFLKLCASAGVMVAADPGRLARAAGSLETGQPARLVDTNGQPLRCSELEVGTNYVFHYPYVSTPCFLLNLGKPAEPGEELTTRDGRQYRWRGGVGPRHSIVAFSAICAHKMSYPTKTVSFINYRHGATPYTDSEFKPARGEQVIYCCSEGSVYDPARGSRVLGGPAPQPLAAIALDYDADGDCLAATGVYGADMFETFFEKFGFQLAMQLNGADFRSPVGATTLVEPLENFTRNTSVC